MRWNTDLMSAILTREQCEAVKRLDGEHYMREDVRRPCDVCLALEAIRTLLTAIEDQGAPE